MPRIPARPRAAPKLCLLPSLGVIIAACAGAIIRPTLVSRRGRGRQMPPLATEDVDALGVRTLREWIDALPDPAARSPARSSPSTTTSPSVSPSARARPGEAMP